MKHKVKNIHFVGVGGSGMSGIAEVLAHLDFNVSGSDIAASTTTRRLEGEGVKVMIAYNSNPDMAEKHAQSLRDAGGIAGAEHGIDFGEPVGGQRDDVAGGELLLQLLDDEAAQLAGGSGNGDGHDPFLISVGE